MRILIVIPSFENGGTNTSLRNLISLIDMSKYHIDVYAITNTGPNRDFVSRYCNVLGIRTDDLKEKSIKSKVLATVFQVVKLSKKILVKIEIDISYILFKGVAFNLSKRNYDLVIAFQEGQATKLVSCFKNSTRISWIRSDYSNMLRIANIKPEKKLYSKIDKIICVSEYTKNVFINLVPNTASKTKALHNLISDKLIVQRAQEHNNLDNNFLYDGFRIVSLGRIDPVKRFSYIPHIVFDLKKRGLDFRWFIIGGGVGQEKEILLKNISKFSVQNELILLGEKNNPYPYIKEADLLVSTSLSEACPNVINEAKILGTPIVSTDFNSIYEFIVNNENGLISPIDSIADKISVMIKDKAVYERIKKNISHFHYRKDEILNTLYKEVLVVK